MKKRIFVAVEISQLVQNKISEYINSLKSEFNELRVGWEKKEKLHLTLKFLGDIDAEQLAGLSEAVGKIGKQISDFRFQISDTGVFPNRKRARILWLGIEDEEGNLKKLNDILEEECEKIGFERENRSFKPHLTIVRLREPSRSKELVQKHLENNFEPVSVEVSGLSIIESKLQPTGSVYHLIQKSRFKNTE